MREASTDIDELDTVRQSNTFLRGLMEKKSQLLKLVCSFWRTKELRETGRYSREQRLIAIHCTRLYNNVNFSRSLTSVSSASRSSHPKFEREHCCHSPKCCTISWSDSLLLCSFSSSWLCYCFIILHAFWKATSNILFKKDLNDKNQ